MDMPVIQSSAPPKQLADAVKSLRGLLAYLMPLILASLGSFGLLGLLGCFNYGGILIGAVTHWSGFIVGGVLFVTSLLGIVVAWDLWGKMTLDLSMLELTELPKEELGMKLHAYREHHKFSTADDEISAETASTVIERVEFFMLGKFDMTLQWGPLLFTIVVAACCILLAVVIKSAPALLLAIWICIAGAAALLCIAGIVVLHCVIKPLLVHSVKPSLASYEKQLHLTLCDGCKNGIGLDSSQVCEHPHAALDTDLEELAGRAARPEEDQRELEREAREDVVLEEQDGMEMGDCVGGTLPACHTKLAACQPCASVAAVPRPPPPQPRRPYPPPAPPAPPRAGGRPVDPPPSLFCGDCCSNLCHKGAQRDSSAPTTTFYSTAGVEDDVASQPAVPAAV
eukprot:CAMPEP_0180563998 /NCGR_PEP_ID=MMETSP1037_2-20121125/4780_1 /TAXON_ID=632150 /ORGANISM="Azadinium spinosum, Strain 3D9" /LENGTH=396 /DNA_ID=CAMNT_0022580877 /DNA_START=57 /DNA_END=1244 /DNA_ORIENTATION=+